MQSRAPARCISREHVWPNAGCMRWRRRVPLSFQALICLVHVALNACPTLAVCAGFACQAMRAGWPKAHLNFHPRRKTARPPFSRGCPLPGRLKQHMGLMCRFVCDVCYNSENFGKFTVSPCELTSYPGCTYKTSGFSFLKGHGGGKTRLPAVSPP